MDKVLRYSVLRYSPSVRSGERINLGILFSEEAVDYKSFRFTRNFKRIKEFDDELDKKSLFSFLESIQTEIELKKNIERFSIEQFTKYYIDKFAFDKPNSIIYSNLNETIEDLYKMYFRFDYDVKERPDKNSDQKLLRQMILSTSNSIYSTNAIKGVFDEKITYDIVTDDYYIKIFDYDGKDLNRLISNAKLWAWNCDHEKEKKVYIIYRYSGKDHPSEEFEIIRKIFEASKGHFCSIEDGMRILGKAG